MGTPGSGAAEFAGYYKQIGGWTHGTMVAGVAAQIAPNSPLASINISSDQNEIAGIFVTEESSDIIQALQQLDANKASYGSNVVVNVSQAYGGCTDTSPANADYTNTKAAIDDLTNYGNIPVVAGTPDIPGTNVILPACVPNAISVAGTLAQTGPFQLWTGGGYNNTVKFAAPAAYVLTPGIEPTTDNLPASRLAVTNDYDGSDAAAGTSFAVPHVAGLYALAKSAAAFQGSTVSGITAWFYARVQPVYNGSACYPIGIYAKGAVNGGSPCP